VVRRKDKPVTAEMSQLLCNTELGTEPTTQRFERCTDVDYIARLIEFQAHRERESKEITMK
jgi:hypothetical protein